MVKFIEMDKLGSEFLKEKYSNPPIHTSHEVASASRGLRSGDPVVRVQKYLDRLESVAGDPENEQRKMKMGEESRPRGLSLLREMVMDTYVRPQQEKLATNAAVVEERAARELGIDIYYGEQELQQRGEIAVKDLENSLDQWIVYLSDKNEPYPIWFRYYAFRNVLGLGRYDKDKNEFPKRSTGTNLLFPDIDRSALGYMEDMIKASRSEEYLKKFREAQLKMGAPENELLTEEKAVAFSRLSFAKQYSESIDQKGEITPEMRVETKGGWARFPQDQDPSEYQPVIKVEGQQDYIGRPLWQSLQNKGVPWCTAGLGTAQTQLQGGDFYVYYTLDKQGKPTIPRIAIRMQGNEVGEARGVLDNAQNVEGNMADIAERQLDKLPGGDKYRKISADMKKMTFLEWKNGLKDSDLDSPKVIRRLQEESQKLFGMSDSTLKFSQAQLVFLYELNSPIEGFGYQRDPRINELRKNRNPKVDAPIVLGCNPDQIAWGTNDIINEKTRAYIGPLYPGIFKVLPNSVEIYKSFPEGRIDRDSEMLQARKGKDYKRIIEVKKVDIYSTSVQMLEDKQFENTRFKGRVPEEVQVVRLRCEDLMRPTDTKGYLTTDEIKERAKELGLLDMPTYPDVILNYIIQHEDKIERGDWFYAVGMETIAGSDGYPHVFDVRRDEDDELWLDGRWTEPESPWSSDDEFVFSFRK